MKMFVPVPVTDTNLLSSTVPETEAGLSVWSAATTYAAGQRCFMTTGIHKIYESVAGGNLNNNPSTTTGLWLEVSATNRWKMFDQATGTVTESTTDIVVEFAIPSGSYINYLTILDITGGTNVKVEILSSEATGGSLELEEGTELEDTLELGGSGVLWSTEQSLLYWADTVAPDWYWYFFSPTSALNSLVVPNLPNHYDSILRVTIETESGSLAVGSILFGTAQDVGETQWGVNLGLMSFSKKETDEFGTTKVLARGFARTMSCDAFLTNPEITRIYRLLSGVKDIPVVWMGSELSLFDSTIIYGFYNSFNIILEGAGGSYCSLEIEGLS